MDAHVVRHRSREAGPGDRGAGLGRAQAARIHRTWSVYCRLFAANAGLAVSEVERLGGLALERIAAWSPPLREEIEGIAAGSGVSPERVGALNARTELLACGRSGECSTVAADGRATADGRPLLAQTWDWASELAGCWLVWTIEHADGRVVETLTEAGLVGKIGVGGGVATAFNILGHDADGGPPGVPVHVLSRSVLDRATTVAEAADVLGSAALSASTAMTVAARDGVCTFELSPAGVYAVPAGDDGLLLRTNHFLAGEPAARDRLRRDEPDTLDRLAALEAAAAGLERPLDGETTVELLAACGCGTGRVCLHADPRAASGERWETLATVVADPLDGRLTVRPGGPCRYASSRSTAAAAAMQTSSRQAGAAS